LIHWVCGVWGQIVPEAVALFEALKKTTLEIRLQDKYARLFVCTLLTLRYSPTKLAWVRALVESNAGDADDDSNLSDCG
jgi:hypothetical protein